MEPKRKHKIYIGFIHTLWLKVILYNISNAPPFILQSVMQGEVWNFPLVVSCWCPKGFLISYFQIKDTEPEIPSQCQNCKALRPQSWLQKKSTSRTFYCGKKNIFLDTMRPMKSPVPTPTRDLEADQRRTNCPQASDRPFPDSVLEKHPVSSERRHDSIVSGRELMCKDRRR